MTVIVALLLVNRFFGGARSSNSRVRMCWNSKGSRFGVQTDSSCSCEFTICQQLA